MELNEALGIAQEAGNRARQEAAAFQRLEEVIAAARTAEGRHAAAEAALGPLDAAIAEKQAELASWNEKTKQARSQYESERADHTRRLSEISATEIASKREELQALDALISGKQEELARIETDYRNRLSILQAEEFESRARLSDVRRQIQALQAGLSKVQ